MVSAPALSIDTVVQRTRRVDFTPLDDDWLAIDAESGFCYNLNEVGGRVWRLIEPPTAIRDVCRQLAREYNVTEATCQADVFELLQQFIEAGLATVVAARN